MLELDPLTVGGLAVGLAMDATAVAAAAGLSAPDGSRRRALRLSFHFGLFQALMPLIGWAAGRGLQDLVDPYGRWAAFVILAVIGSRMIISSLKKKDPAKGPDPSRGFLLVALSMAVSIDALAAGVSLGLLGAGILVPALVIGLVTALMSLVGYRLGAALGRRAGSALEALGGIILILIGLKTLIYG